MTAPGPEQWQAPDGWADGTVWEHRVTVAKAIGGAVVGFLAPGAAYLLGVAQGGNAPITGQDWLVALLSAVVGSAATGTAVYRLPRAATPQRVPSGPQDPADTGSQPGDR